MGHTVVFNLCMVSPLFIEINAMNIISINIIKSISEMKSADYIITYECLLVLHFNRFFSFFNDGFCYINIQWC